MPSPRTLRAALVALLLGAAGAAQAAPTPPRPAPREDPSHPDFAPCRAALAQAVADYNPGSHPPAPARLTKDGDLSYDLAREYTQKLQAAFNRINDSAFRTRCEPHLRNPDDIRANYMKAHAAMNERLAWHQAALDTHCQGHAEHSRQVGQAWLGKYRGLKALAGGLSLPKSPRSFLDYEMGQWLNAKGTTDVDRACLMFTEALGVPDYNHSRSTIAPMERTCIQDKQEYQGALTQCRGICQRRGKANQCDTFWTR